jgi:hypothetical protein
MPIKVAMWSHFCLRSPLNKIVLMFL